MSNAITNISEFTRECNPDAMPPLLELAPLPCCDLPQPADNYTFPPPNIPLIPDVDILDGVCIPIEPKPETAPEPSVDYRGDLMGVSNTRLCEHYYRGDSIAYVYAPSDRPVYGSDGKEICIPACVPYPDKWCDSPAGTPVRIFSNNEEQCPTSDGFTDFTILDMDDNCDEDRKISGEGCEIIEPVRCPRFYDKNITPNPMMVDAGGFFLPEELKLLDNGVNAFMSMGLLAVDGKEYSPLQATYQGGEPYTQYDEELGREVLMFRRMGEPMFDNGGNPLYLMRRELVIEDNSVTVRKGKDTSFPFKWQYIDGEPFSSLEVGADDEAQDDNEVNYYDYFELKPFYLYSSVAEDDEDGNELIPEQTGISPRTWRLTIDPDEAQLNYDFAYCPDLDWAEVLVPGEKVECEEKTVSYKVREVDEFGELVIAEKNFKYYEIIPPASYRTPIDGQPSVELYVGTGEEVTAVSSETGDLAITTLRKEDRYIKAEDVILPDYELVYAALSDSKAEAELVNPLAVISDLQTDRNGHLTKRLRALFYKKDNENRLYPMLFEVDILPFGYCIEVGNTKHYYGTEEDECSPYVLRESYTVERANRRYGQKGMSLQLVQSKCFKHRLQVPMMVRR